MHLFRIAIFLQNNFQRRLLVTGVDKYPTWAIRYARSIAYHQIRSRASGHEPTNCTHSKNPIFVDPRKIFVMLDSGLKQFISIAILYWGSSFWPPADRGWHGTICGHRVQRDQMCKFHFAGWLSAQVTFKKFQYMHKHI